MKLGKKIWEGSESDPSTMTAQERYADGLKQFGLFYWELVIGAVIVLVIAVLLALYSSILIGLAVSAAVGCIYTYFTADELKKRLGLSYRSEEGSLIVTGLDAKGAEELYLPSRLMWWDVEILADHAMEKEGNTSLSALHLPRSLRRIEAEAFCGCENLTRLLYEGTEVEWAKVACEAELASVTLVFDVAYPALSKKEKPKKEKKRKKDTEEKACEQVQEESVE